jgi:hypothetical protein
MGKQSRTCFYLIIKIRRGSLKISDVNILFVKRPLSIEKMRGLASSGNSFEPIVIYYFRDDKCKLAYDDLYGLEAWRAWHKWTIDSDSKDILVEYESMDESAFMGTLLYGRDHSHEVARFLERELGKLAEYNLLIKD